MRSEALQVDRLVRVSGVEVEAEAEADECLGFLVENHIRLITLCGMGIAKLYSRHWHPKVPGS